MSLKKYNSIMRYIGNETIFFRGYNYYKERKVLEFYYEDGYIDAIVDGSKYEYEVHIELDTDGSIRRSLCSCPYFIKNGPCKHIAAVLIYNFENNYNNSQNKSIPLEKVLINDKEFFDNPTKIPIENIKGKINFDEEDVKFISPKNLNRKERWRLIFSIEKFDDYNPFFYKPDAVVIRPYLQYKKLDGTYSRIKSFNPDHLTEKISADEQILLSRIKNRNLSYLETNFEFILNSKIPFFYKEYKSYYPLTVLQIKKIEILLEVDKFSYKEIIFAPILVIHTINGKKFKLINFIKSIFITDNINYGILSQIQDSGDFFLFVKQNDSIGSSFMKTLIELSKRRDLTFATINELKKQVLEYIDYININTDVEEVVIERPIPKPFLYIIPDRKGIFLNLMFDYVGEEIEFRNSFSDGIVTEKFQDKKLYIFLTNIEYEREVFSALIEKFDILRNYSVDFDTKLVNIIVDMDVLKFLKEYGNKLIDAGIGLKIEGTDNKISKTGGSLTVKVNSDIDWFDINVEYKDTDGNEIPINIDKKLLNSGLIKIGKSYTILNKEDIEKIKLLLEEGMSETGKLKVSKYNFNIIDELYNNIQNKEKEIKDIAKISKQLKNFDKIKNYRLPQNLKASLREYQKAGYNWLNFLHTYNLNGCLADDMGLGKTVQTLAFLQNLKEEKKLKTSLIIVPVSVVLNWENEIKTFTPKLKHLIHIGAKRKKDINEFLKYDIIITSYNTLRNDIKIFNEIEFYYIILDEAQNIKNARSLTYKAIKTLKSKHRLTLTGTPIENNTLELWSQMNFLNPGLLGSIEHFKKTFAVPIESKKDTYAMEKLRKMIFPFILRRKKEDVIKDLPEKTEIVLYSELDKKQREVYDSFKKYFSKRITEKIEMEGVEKNTFEILTALLKLRQISLFPGLADEKYSNIPSGKFEQLKENINELIQENHKILIFSQFVKVLKIIAEYLDFLKIKYSYLDGSIPSTKRSKIIKEFQENEDNKIFLLSLKAGGVGINLTAADYVFIFDPWWNPAVEMQAIDRAHRIGQKNKVFSFKLIAKDTVEEKILKLQEKKKNLVKNIITTEAGFFKSLSKKDIVDLFK